MVLRSQEKCLDRWCAYLGLLVFLMVNFIFASYFVTIRDDSSSVLRAVDPFSSQAISVTILSVLFVFFLQFFLAIYFTMNKIRKESKLQFHPDIEEGSNSTHWGNYKPEEIGQLLEKVSKNAGIPIYKAFISTDVIPKVFSYNFLGKRVIILNANLLQIFSARELEAAIGIELGFTKNPITSYITYLNFAVTYFLAIVYAVPFLNLFKAIILTWLNSGSYKFSLSLVVTEVFYLIGFVIILPLLLTTHKLALNYANRNVQFFADNNATTFVGKKNIINMLIKLGQRTEALDILLREIKWLEELKTGKVYPFDEERLIEILNLFPPNELSENRARELAANVFITSKIDVLKKTYCVEFPDLKANIDAAAGILREKRKDYLEEMSKKSKDLAHKEQVTVDWRKFDADGNLDLDEAELESFISALEENKNMFLFENEEVGNLLFSDRVPIHTRILSIYKTKNQM